MNMKKNLLAALAAVFGVEKFATAQLADGTEIQYEGELVPGTMVTVTVDGAQVPAPEGEHALGGDMEGKTIVLDATGSIVEVKDTVAAGAGAGAGEEGMSAEEEAFVAQVTEKFNAFKKEQADLKKSHNDLIEKFNKVVDEINKSKAEKDKFKRAEKVDYTKKLA